eukprot:g2091.t1
MFQSLRSSKSTKDLTAHTKVYPSRESDYQLIEACGRGITATVWYARCKTNGDHVAVKILDMDRLNCKMEEVMHEAQAMCLYHHPNVLPLYSAFVVGKHLWFVEPYVKGGSVYNIMKFSHPNGLDEVLIAIIMKEVARALEYVHRCGGIHRDVKAGNILIDDDGSVLLADFGVAATIERGGSWGNDKINRSTFVGTPCWMAPEVMEQTSGYNSKADIWSFGITLLELAHGNAPFSKLPPMKVLLMTIQNPPPQLEPALGQRHFSKHLRDLVANCLQKDPSKRPTAAQILESKLFKNIPDTRYLAVHLVDNLPCLTERAKSLEAMSGPSPEDQLDEMKTKEDYVRGMSTWDFSEVLSLKEAASQHNNIPESKTESSKDRAEAMLEDLVTAQVLDKSQDQSSNTSRVDSTFSPRQELALSPTRKTTTDLHSDQLGESTKSASHEKNGKPSRFSVTTTKHPSNKKIYTTPPPPHEASTVPSEANNPHTLYRSHSRGDDFASSSAVDLTEHEREYHKSVYNKGRFRIHEEVVKTDKAAKPVGTSSPQVLAGGSTSIPLATALSDQLQNLLQTQKQMFTNLEQITEALKEAEKGNPGQLQTLLASNVGKGLESRESLLHRIKELENENKALKERILASEKQSTNPVVGNGPAPDKS